MTPRRAAWLLRDVAGAEQMGFAELTWFLEEREAEQSRQRTGAGLIEAMIRGIRSGRSRR